jgi:hypothetical protein
MYNEVEARKVILVSILQFLGGFVLLATMVWLTKFIVNATVFELITHVEKFLTTTGILLFVLYLGYNHERKEEIRLSDFLALFGNSPTAFWVELKLFLKKTTKAIVFILFFASFVYSFCFNIFVPFSQYFS